MLKLKKTWTWDGDKTRPSHIRKVLTKNKDCRQVNASQQVHSKVNEGPHNSLCLVLLLLEHEHVVVEELLKLLVGEVNAKLLESVVLKVAIRQER
ncbi:hypothetical protein J437_LFUL003528 [Ladona fulva]|uniref:Uncharacterized protein n=1 Tax=Ladona fulva TaxID=123851 RepID=A0A8K0JZ01_LADFU|nr:hypothetical protein J437_LFUL003528 [Ladona fulva]